MSAKNEKIRYLLLHLPGPMWKAGVDFREQPGIQDHVQYYQRLLETGKLERGGPFIGGALGAMIMPIAEMDKEELARFADEDPAVQSGLLTYEIWTWLVEMQS